MDGSNNTPTPPLSVSTSDAAGNGGSAGSGDGLEDSDAPIVAHKRDHGSWGVPGYAKRRLRRVPSPVLAQGSYYTQLPPAQEGQR